MAGQMSTAEKVVEIPSQRLMPCAGCGADVLVGKNTVIVFCRPCSAKMGVKR